MCRPISLVAFCVLVLGSVSLRAQSSTSFDRADKYQAAKAVLQQFYEHGVVPSNINQDDQKEGVYDLLNCQEYGYYMGFLNEDQSGSKPIAKQENDDLPDLMEIALNVVIWENDLRKLGVPEGTWRPVLDEYEANNLTAKSDAIDADVPQLAAQLNARMTSAGRSRPKFVERGGCGSGGADVHFELNPPDGQLFLIPVFLYKVCQVQRLVPTDFKSCNRWKEVFTASVPSLTGDYVYLARWADGVVRCGSVSEDDFWKKNDSTIVITELRSPQCSLAW